jgi:ethanolamine ammonia-lyase small subunit
MAREAIQAELRVEALQEIAPFRVVETEARTKEEHLGSPALGSRLSATSRALLAPEGREIQVVVSDGLSAEAVHHQLKDLYAVLVDGFEARGIAMGAPIAARYGRVKLAEDIADRVEASLTIHLIGERPGGDALSSRSLSAYLVYRLADPEVRELAARFSENPSIRFEYTVISSIHEGGLPPIEAGAVIVEKAARILAQKAAGNRLEAMR